MTVSYSDYNLWMVLIVHAIFFIIFVSSFSRPNAKIEWLGIGAFCAFILALFSGMNGFLPMPYSISEWFGNLFSQFDFHSLNTNYWWRTWFGTGAHSPGMAVHVASSLIMLSGLLLACLAWERIRPAQKKE